MGRRARIHHQPHREAERRRWPVWVVLVGIVFVLVLPSLVFCGILIERIASGERARVTQTAVAAAGRAADALDREIGTLSAAMLALSSSPALTGGEWAAFHEQASPVAAALGHTLALTSPDGQVLVNTRFPFGTALPRSTAGDALRAAVETRTPQVTNLYTGAATGVQTIAILHPVLRQGKVVAVLALSLRTTYLSSVLLQQGFAPGWIAAITDGNNRIIGRTADADRLTGREATAAPIAPTPGEQHVWTGQTLDGEPTLAVSQQLHMAAWRIRVAVPVRLLEAPLRSTLTLLAIVGAVALSTACVLAWVLARSVARPLRRLAELGSQLALSGPVPGVRSSIAEVDAVSRALVQATRDLRSRADALAAERAQLAAVIDTVPVGIIFADAQGRILAGNQQLDTILRHPLRQSTSVEEYAQWVSWHPDGRLVQPAEYPLSRVLAGAAQAELRCHYERGDGTKLWVQFVAAPIRAPDGTITGGVVAMLDIDEIVRARAAEARFADSLEAQVLERTKALEAANLRLRNEMGARAAAEEQLRQAQKMEAVGQLTGGIAHDFNNLLTIVIGSLDLLRRRSHDGRTLRLLDNAMAGANRAATLTARLLAFSRRQPLLPQTVDVNALVSGMSDLLHRTLGEGVHVETRLASMVWHTQADPNQLENALLNLAVNGRDAVVSAGREGGSLVFETGNSVLDPAALAHDPDVPPGDYVRVSVRDNGVGIAEHVAARVFEPFYTTKPPGQGTGLGLSQVHGFVKQSGGHVTIDTQVGVGTTISIYLPRISPAAVVATVDEAAQRPTPCPSGTVLLVEDECGVREYSAEALRDLGHTVLAAASGPAALDLLDAHPEIALLLTDVLLPGMDGVRLAEAARQRRPDLPVLFASGYTGGAARQDALVPPGAPMLQKPFDVQGLAAKLAEVMHA